jgi:hypothetical protein
LRSWCVIFELLLRLVSSDPYPRVQNENVASAADQIRELALSFAEAHEDRP